MNVFATLLTYPAPSANYRGENEMNRAVLQRITRGRHEYAVISPEAIRNALRETLASYKLPCNRSRLDNEDQLAVKFQDYPFPERWADDFLFGYMVADRKQVPDDVVKARNFQFKRDSILRTNLAVALEPFRQDALLTQSPLTKNSPWQNAGTSALLHREITLSAFQFPLAFNLQDFALDDNSAPVPDLKRPDNGAYPTRGEQYRDWLMHLLKAMAELNGVAGNAARSYFEMAPASIVVRVTTRLAAGYDLYGFKPEGSFPEVVDQILKGDLPGQEFWMGGAIIREALPAEVVKELVDNKVKTANRAEQTLNSLSLALTGKAFL